MLTAGCQVGWIQFQDTCYFFSHTVTNWYEAGVSTVAPKQSGRQ